RGAVQAATEHGAVMVDVGGQGQLQAQALLLPVDDLQAHLPGQGNVAVQYGLQILAVGGHGRLSSWSSFPLLLPSKFRPCLRSLSCRVLRGMPRASARLRMELCGWASSAAINERSNCSTCSLRLPPGTGAGALGLAGAWPSRASSRPRAKRSAAFCSSRTLPGQSWRRSMTRWAG